GSSVEDSCARDLIEQQQFQRARRARQVAEWHVERGVAAAFAGDGGVEQKRRHAGGQRFERRQPESFVLRQERERSCVCVQFPELIIADVLVPPNLSQQTLGRDRHAQILPWIRAV